MRAVVQRVSWARVRVGTEQVGAIGQGLLVLLGVAEGDGEPDVDYLASKVVNLRVFEDAEGKMNHSLLEVGRVIPNAPSGTSLPPASISLAPTLLVISQFTLIASTRKGNRPSFNDAAKPDVAIPLYESFVRHAATALGRPVATGRFGAMMEVSLVNQGPVTLTLDSRLRE